jgi:hypothetical protein
MLTSLGRPVSGRDPFGRQTAESVNPLLVEKFFLNDPLEK